MKSVRVACVAVVALLGFVPVAAAQKANAGLASSNFSVEINGAALNMVRSVEFQATPAAQLATGRGKGGATAEVKLVVSRAEASLLDAWLADTKAPRRSIKINLLDAAGKAKGAYDLSNCAIAASSWTLDAANNAIATETWTFSCEGGGRTG